MIDYGPLWDTLRRKEISQYYLLNHGLDHKTPDALTKNKNITLLTLEKLCKIIGCTPDEIVEFK